MRPSFNAILSGLRKVFAPALLILALMIATLLLAAMIVSVDAHEARPASADLGFRPPPDD